MAVVGNSARRCPWYALKIGQNPQLDQLVRSSHCVMEQPDSPPVTVPLEARHCNDEVVRVPLRLNILILWFIDLGLTCSNPL